MHAHLDGADWSDGRATVGAQGARVKRNLQLPEISPLAQELAQAILAALATNPRYFAAALPLRTVPPLFNCDESGGEYGFHVDGAVRAVPAMPGCAPWLRTDLSATLFLCEPEAYEGGELIVSDTYGEHEVRLPAGDLILYLSSSLHRVTPVTRGAPHCSNWIRSSRACARGARTRTPWRWPITITTCGGCGPRHGPRQTRLSQVTLHRGLSRAEVRRRGLGLQTDFEPQPR